MEDETVPRIRGKVRDGIEERSTAREVVQVAHEPGRTKLHVVARRHVGYR